MALQTEAPSALALSPERTATTGAASQHGGVSHEGSCARSCASASGYVGGRRGKGAGAMVRMTHKERVLLEWARGAFDKLGPRALPLMESIVLHDHQQRQLHQTNRAAGTLKRPRDEHNPHGGNGRNGTSASYANGGGAAAGSVGGLGLQGQTLRGIDRFFRRIEANDGEAAFWSLRKIDASDPREPRKTVVPPEVCAGDPYFRNDYHATPMHVFASLKRAVTAWQKRYVDCFGRRVPATGWPFPSTLCQVVSFYWMMSEGILERLRLLSRVPDPRALNGSLPPISKRPRRPHRANTANNANNARPARAALQDEGKQHQQGKGREIYAYDYPCYLEAPPVEGAGPDDPLGLDPLPLLCPTADAVRQYYEHIVDRLLYQDSHSYAGPPSGSPPSDASPSWSSSSSSLASSGGDRVVETEELDLPLLVPIAANGGTADAGLQPETVSFSGTTTGCGGAEGVEDLDELDDEALLMAAMAPKKKKPKRSSLAGAAAGFGTDGTGPSLFPSRSAAWVARPDANGQFAETDVPLFETDSTGLPLFLVQPPRIRLPQMQPFTAANNNPNRQLHPHADAQAQPQDASATSTAVPSETSKTAASFDQTLDAGDPLDEDLDPSLVHEAD